MAVWPANGDTDWNTKNRAFITVGHDLATGKHTEAGLTAQILNTQTGAVSTGTTAIPDDDTIPQITEGDEYMTLAITPASATNKLMIEVIINISPTAGNLMTVALFQDATANALATSRQQTNVAQTMNLTLRHFMAAGTTSATTFRVRAGATGGTNTFNGTGGARRNGGVMASSITITEILV